MYYEMPLAHPFARHQLRTRRGIGGSLPSYKRDESAFKQASAWKLSTVRQDSSGEHPHLVVEDARLSRLCGLDEVRVEDLENVAADLCELGLNLLAVLLDVGKRIGSAFALCGRVMSQGRFAPSDTNA